MIVYIRIIIHVIRTCKKVLEDCLSPCKINHCCFVPYLIPQLKNNFGKLKKKAFFISVSSFGKRASEFCQHLASVVTPKTYTFYLLL